MAASAPADIPETLARTRKIREQVRSRWTQLENEYSGWRSHYQDISTFLLPRNGRYFVQDRNRGAPRNNRIYDNTGTRALRITGAGLMAGATSPARPWARVVSGDLELDGQHTVKTWLNAVTRLVLRVFAKSNTYRVLHQMYEEMAAFGTAACILLPDFDNVIHLYPMTAGEYRLATNYQGTVDTCYRRFEKTVAETVKEFGLENCSTTVKTAYRNGALHNAVTIIHAIEPRADRDPTKKDNRNLPWTSIYFEEGSDEDQILRESGFEKFPVLAPRWAVAGGDVYGHGPGMEALGDVKQLQHEQLRKSQGIDFQSLPPKLVPTEMKGQESKWVPGGLIYVPATAAAPSVRPAVQVELNLSHLLADIQDVRTRIVKAFFADLFQMLEQIDTKMTATEVAARNEERLVQLGPVLERLHTELLEPLVHRTYEILLDAGVLPPPPPELHGRDLAVEFISVLAQAQRAVGIAGIDRALAIAVQTSQVKPRIVDNIDEDALWNEVTDVLGVTPKITRNPVERDQLRAAQAQAQKAQAQAAMMGEQAKTAKDLGTTPTGGKNALSDVMALFSGMDHPAPQAYG